MKTVKMLRTIVIVALAGAALWLAYLGGAFLVRMVLQMHGMGG